MPLAMAPLHTPSGLSQILKTSNDIVVKQFNFNLGNVSKNQQ